GNPQIDLQDKGVSDSGCSRLMTGNMSYLTYYEEIDEGYVAFGGNPKGWKITGRGSGLNWLFDIDALTKSMNYKPVITGNQSNGNAGTKACDDADNELSFNLEMPALEDISTFTFSSDHEDADEEDDINNMDTAIQVSPTPTIRIHKDHPLDQVIRDLHSSTQTRNMSKNLEEHGFVTTIPYGKRAIATKWVFWNKKDERGIVIRNKARLGSQGHTQEEGINYDEVFASVMDVKSAFLYGKIEEEVYVCQPLGFEDPDFPDKVYKVEKALYGLHQARKA
nr:hypothetical protein [Tanacetum cinerariifolium]